VTSKDVLLAIVTGTIDPMLAFMNGQISIDNPLLIVNFAKSFDLSKESLAQYKRIIDYKAASWNSVVSKQVTTVDNNNNNNNNDNDSNKQIVTVDQSNMAIQKISGTYDNCNSVNNSITRNQRIEAKIAVVFLKFIEELQKFVEKMNQQIEKLKENPKFQSFVGSVENTVNNIKESHAYQVIQSSPAVIHMKELILKDMQSNKIPETFQSSKRKAIYISSLLISSLTEIAYGPIKQCNTSK